MTIYHFKQEETMPQDKSAFDDLNFDKETFKETFKEQEKPSVDPAGNPIKNVGVTEDDQKEYLASRPYKAERSALHKGKFARPGHVFLKVKVKWKDREYANVREFPSADLTQGVMNHLYDKLYEEIKEHHQQQQGIKKK